MARRLGIQTFNTFYKSYKSFSSVASKSPTYSSTKILNSSPLKPNINYLNISRFNTFSPCYGKTGEFKNLADRLLTIKIDENQDKKSEKKESGKKIHQYVIFVSCGLIGAASLMLVYTMGSPDCDEKRKPIKDEFSDLNIVKGYILRANKEIREFCQFFRNPSREKLLPDHPQDSSYYKAPYTLVLEMKGLMVHPDWTYNTGWRFKKRPFLDYFLSQVGYPKFEVVVYTSEQGFTAMPVLEKLDPNGYISFRLFRDTTRYMNGHHVKDLSCLNRDLTKVIILDWDDRSYQLQPRNALKIKKWDGNDDDKLLIDLAEFLRMLSESGIEDVRSVLDYYRQFDDPLKAFKENQQKLAEKQEASEKSALAASTWKKFIKK